MFIEALILTIIIGYLLKGRLRNLENVKIQSVYLVIIAFFIEFLIVLGLKKGFLHKGTGTYIIDMVMYFLIFIFIYQNRKDRFLLIMGAGFLLNAIPIFFNGGAMPVSKAAIRISGITSNVDTEGLYTLVNTHTRFSFLGDIIPLTFPRRFAVSLGDIISAIGLMFFIVKGMKKINE